jgi:hypothetical protein
LADAIVRAFPNGANVAAMLFYSMNKTWVLMAAAMIAILPGCSSPTLLREPVGPDPFVSKTADPDGTLRVFTATEEVNDIGFETAYSQRTDYTICDWNGKTIQHVRDNNKGHFEATPRSIQLRPGIYNIRALAAIGLGEWIMLPVVVEAGRTTDVHLNGHWRPPVDSPETAFVHTPTGRPIGWRATTLPNG